EENPLFDINEFMNEVDILLNDYSATTTDYALLDRAQIFCMPDYDKYWNYKGVSFIPIDAKNTPYREILPGPEVHTYDELLVSIKDASNNYEGFINRYRSQSNNILDKFYNTNYSNSSENIYQLMKTIINS
ncbi:MAG: CDP-glycerol glycerophosphotransferase family protein, partial [Pseudomonadota bacterium]|nr:CDP-glycerol glycerophosphotransferase family protein [Pseudomonadota bacterium]